MAQASRQSAAWCQPDMLDRYAAASGEYLLAVLYRVGDEYKLDLRSSKAGAPNPQHKLTDISTTPVSTA